jgi:hypothetical protein
MHLQVETKVGTAAGAFAGIVKGLVNMVHVIGFITWSAVWETSFFAFVGATVGFFTTQLWRYIKKKF